MPQLRWLSQVGKGLALITVEPSMAFYMMAFMITTVLEQAFFVDKACRVNHKFNSTICNNITEYEDYNKIVQVSVSEFHQWNDVAGHLGPIILALFMGAWSDKRGRKLPLLIGLFGKFYYSCMIVLIASQDTWPVEYVIYIATLPMAFTGADVAIFAASFSYISDVSTKENRTIRITLLEVCYLATMPTGIALGSFLFRKVVNQSYAIMFTINASIMAVSIIYTCVRLEWRTSENQRPLSEAKNIFLDFFDYEHVVQTVKTILKKRPMRRRTYLILLIIGMACYTFQRDEKNTFYLYFQLVLKWGYGKISNFRTYQSALQAVILLLAIPFMAKILRMKDSNVIIIGCLAHSAARLFFAYASLPSVIYFGGAFAALGPIVAPVIRSMTSKLISTAERGKAFSVLAVADNAVPILSGVIYNQVYKATMHTYPNAFFFVTILTQLLVIVIIVFIEATAKEHALIHEEEEINEQCLENETAVTNR